MQDKPSFGKCSPEIQASMKRLDLRAETFSLPFSELRTGSRQCLNEVMDYLASRLSSSASEQLLSESFSLFSEFNAMAEPTTVKKIKTLMEGIKLTTYLAPEYFTALTVFRLDLRSVLKGKIKENWDADENGHLDSLTWRYYRYLAHLEDLSAVDKIAEKVERLKRPGKGRASSETRLSVLRDLIELTQRKNLALVDKVHAVLSRFLDDQSPITIPGGDPLPGSNEIDPDTAAPTSQMLALDLTVSFLANAGEACSGQYYSDLMSKEKHSQLLKSLVNATVDCLNIIVPALAVTLNSRSSQEELRAFHALLAARDKELTDHAKVPVKYAYQRIPADKDDPNYRKAVESFAAKSSSRK